MLMKENKMMNKKIVLCLGSTKNYFFLEVLEAFDRLGFRTILNINEINLSNIKPCLIFCVNDIRPKISEKLNDVPLISWIGERPVFPYLLAMDHTNRLADFIFVTDKTFVNSLKCITDNVYFLPLAKGNIGKDMCENNYKFDISFVGNTMDKEIEFYKNSTDPYFYIENISKIEEEIVNSYENKSCMYDIRTIIEQSEYIQSELKKITKNYNFKSNLVNFNYNLFLGLVGMILTREKRIHYLRNLNEKFKLMLIGDLWDQYFKNSICNTSIEYKEINNIYNSSKININISSMHMPTAQNSRIFDVPATGGFLITDYREGLEELFELEKEVITYSSEEEMIEKCKFYLNNDSNRKFVVKNANKRILEQHTFEHRLKKILDIVHVK